MNSDFLNKKWETLDEHRKLQLVDKTLVGANRLKDMIDWMGKFNRTKKEIKPTSIEEVINNSILFLKYKLNTLSVKTEVSIEENFPQILANETSLEQVFSNLISNACDAMEASATKRILISGETQGEELVLKVTDTGKGISEENLENIFKSFFTTKEAGEGTGLSLSSTSQILNDMGARIKVESQLGEGTTFYLCFRPLTKI